MIVAMKMTSVYCSTSVSVGFKCCLDNDTSLGRRTGMRFHEPKSTEQLRVGLNGAMIFKLISLVSN